MSINNTGGISVKLSTLFHVNQRIISGVLHKKITYLNIDRPSSILFCGYHMFTHCYVADTYLHCSVYMLLSDNDHLYCLRVQKPPNGRH